MSSTITPPKSNVPVGQIVIAGVKYDVPQHPEMVRFFSDLAKRVGGINALTNIDLADQIADLDSEGLDVRSDTTAAEAMRAVDELRNEVSSLRSDCDGLRAALAERDAELAGLRAVADLRPRVEQLEDRITS